jgi:hypothetical protein
MNLPRDTSRADWNEFSGVQLSRLNLVHVAPHPVFLGLDGAYERMLAFVKVFGGVLVLGRVTAANLPALQAEPQMDPSVPHFDTFFAHVLVGAGYLYLVEVHACGGH